MCKPEFLNGRFVYGGGVETKYGNQDDYAHTTNGGVDVVRVTGHVAGGGTAANDANGVLIVP
ncbi:MAG: hypothetical protein RLZZ546_1416 [Bacteroidota bacterium]